MGVSKKHQVNQQDIDMIKALLTAGLSYTQVSKLSKRSWNVVTLVDKCNGTVKDYKRLGRERNARYAAKREQEKVGTVEHAIKGLATTKANVPEPVSLKETIEAMGNLNDVRNIGQRLDHIETQMQEIIDLHHDVIASLSAKKIIW